VGGFNVRNLWPTSSGEASGIEEWWKKSCFRSARQRNLTSTGKGIDITDKVQYREWKRMLRNQFHGRETGAVVASTVLASAFSRKRSSFRLFRPSEPSEGVHRSLPYPGERPGDPGAIRESTSPNCLIILDSSLTVAGDRVGVEGGALDHHQ